MTNKDNIQAQHLEAISKNVKLEYPNYDAEISNKGNKSAATSCTTVTAEAIGEAMEWAIEKGFKRNKNTGKYFVIMEAPEYTLDELKDLFLNQKAKI